MKRGNSWSKWLSSMFLVPACLHSFSTESALAQEGGGPQQPRQGLALRVEADGRQSWAIATGVALAASNASAAHPFLTARPYTATWSGRVNMELRSDVLFQATLNGTLELEINGTNVLSASNSGGPSQITKPVRLRKGPNDLRAIFRSSSNGLSHVSLNWGEKAFLMAPIPAEKFDHLPNTALDQGILELNGRNLFLELKCLSCHSVKGNPPRSPELAPDAPSLEGIGSRRNRDWLRRWVLNPREYRSQARMPQMFRGPQAAHHAEATAAYLASLKAASQQKHEDPPPWKRLTPEPEPGNRVARPLLEKLKCAACHTWPGSEGPDATKIALDAVREKFPEDGLVEFLQKPEAHYRWIRMPNFRLTRGEAVQLARELTGKLRHAAPDSQLAGAAEPLISEGRVLVENSGCLNCHGGATTQSKLKMISLDGIGSTGWGRGCMGTEPGQRGLAPDFGLTAREREELRAFAKADTEALWRHAPWEFAARHSKLLRCTSCHGQIESVPAFDVLGGKLQTDWSAQFMAGSIPYKPRDERHPNGEPWVEARMPAFPAYATALAHGLAAGSGHGPDRSDAEHSDPALAEIGRRLIGKEGGFSCVSCHGLGSSAALEVFDSQGVHLSWSASRLRKDYFVRWMKQPLAIDPSTKMPAYFDEEGNSPLQEVLDGNASRQIDALWEFLLREGKPVSDGGRSGEKGRGPN
ncbi:MAG: cytochrome c [Verrucomicrobia bacterium]|nr:cytochrome c [Verrucomicrobiota bacterium]